VNEVLVVDDESQLLRALRITLTARGYDVHTAATGRRALAEASTRPPDLVILDLGLPDIDGAEVINQLRAHSAVPIIVLSGRTSAADKVAALDAGADDYITKPFGIEELLARIRAVTRRTATDDCAVIVELGDHQVDLGARRVSSRTGGNVRLTPTEWRLLDALATAPGVLRTHEWLLAEVWEGDGAPDVEALRVFVSQLRRKIEPDPRHPRAIVTESRIGYRWQVEPTG